MFCLHVYNIVVGANRLKEGSGAMDPLEMELQRAVNHYMEENQGSLQEQQRLLTAKLSLQATHRFFNKIQAVRPVVWVAARLHEKSMCNSLIKWLLLEHSLGGILPRYFNLSIDEYDLRKSFFTLLYNLSISFSCFFLNLFFLFFSGGWSEGGARMCVGLPRTSFVTQYQASSLDFRDLPFFASSVRIKGVCCLTQIVW